MKERPYSGFYARLLGSFSLDFQGERMQIDVGMQTLSMQLLLMMLKAGSRGLDKKEMLKLMRGNDGEPMIRARNLRQQTYLLRKIIARSHFPPGRYIILQENRYFFSLDYQVETDTDYLDEILQRLQNTRDSPERIQLLQDYCRGYTGEFLPMLCGEEWVTIESAYYHNKYIKCINELYPILKKNGDYEQILEICTAASQIHPYDEWQAAQIDCLMAMNRYGEALKIYEEATKLFYEDLGVTSLDRVMAGYRNYSGQPYYIAGALRGIKDSLREKAGTKGAYRLSYPAFLDLYRIMDRLKERMNMDSLLMVCTLHLENESNADGESARRLDQQMELFGQMLFRNLRKGDAYTRYSQNQFLVLLIGAEEKSEKGIALRLNNIWKKQYGGSGIRMELEMQSLMAPAAEVRQK